jgi:hypothetical protein
VSNETETKKVKIHFEVKVWTETMPPVFTYIDKNGNITNGNAITSTKNVNEVIYALTEADLCFYVGPQLINPGVVITDDIDHDLTSTVSEDGKTLKMKFSPRQSELVGFQLIVQHLHTRQLYASPDPRLLSKYRV